MKVVALVQARMSSKRLPGKSMIRLAGKPSLQWIIERARPSRELGAFGVATSDLPSDEPIASLCGELNVPCFRGSEQDVLQRMWDAACYLKADVLVRLTGDNPFVNHELIDGAIRQYRAEMPPLAYLNTAEPAGWPVGLMVEVVDMKALGHALNSTAPEDREHVTWFVRQRPKEFRQKSWPAPYVFQNVRLTIDTLEDYDFASKLFERLLSVDPIFGLEAISLA